MRAHLREIQGFVPCRLADVRRLLEGDLMAARGEIARHVQAIRLLPDGKTYKIEGDWGLVSGESGGAGGPSRTKRAIPFTVFLGRSRTSQ